MKGKKTNSINSLNLFPQSRNVLKKPFFKRLSLRPGQRPHFLLLPVLKTLFSSLDHIKEERHVVEFFFCLLQIPVPSSFKYTQSASS